MEETLLEKLARIREALSAEGVGAARLEQLRSETKRAFDAAIRRMSVKINYREELAKRGAQLRRFRVGFFRMVFPIQFRYLVSMPFIYGMLVPMIVFHIVLEIYQQVCFRLYGIPLVKPSEYFINERRFLPYLNWLEKFHCMYCSYYNNLMRYSTEIGGRTELYWCPIKYSQRINHPHSKYKHFVDYLDAEGFRKKITYIADFPKSIEEDPKKCDFMK
jgi:hypothetical protein